MAQSSASKIRAAAHAARKTATDQNPNGRQGSAREKIVTPLSRIDCKNGEAARSACSASSGVQSTMSIVGKFVAQAAVLSVGLSRGVLHSQ